MFVGDVHPVGFDQEDEPGSAEDSSSDSDAELSKGPPHRVDEPSRPSPRDRTQQHGHHSPKNVLRRKSFGRAERSTPKFGGEIPTLRSLSPMSRPRSMSMGQIRTNRIDHERLNNINKYRDVSSTFQPISNSISTSPPRWKYAGSSPPPKPSSTHHLAPPKVDNGRPKSPSFRRRQYKTEQSHSVDQLSLPQSTEVHQVFPTKSSPLLSKRKGINPVQMSPRPLSPRHQAIKVHHELGCHHDGTRKQQERPHSAIHRSRSPKQIECHMEVTLNDLEQFGPKVKLSGSGSYVTEVPHLTVHLPEIVSPKPSIAGPIMHVPPVSEVKRMSLSVKAGSSTFKDVFNKFSSGQPETPMDKVNQTPSFSDTYQNNMQTKERDDREIEQSNVNLQAVEEEKVPQNIALPVEQYDETLHPKHAYTHTRKRSSSFSVKTRVSELAHALTKEHKSEESIPATSSNTASNQNRIADKVKCRTHPETSLSDERLSSSLHKETKFVHFITQLKDHTSTGIDDGGAPQVGGSEEDTEEDLVGPEPTWTKTNILKHSHRASIADAPECERMFTAKYPVYQLERTQPNVFVIVHDDDTRGKKSVFSGDQLTVERENSEDFNS